MVKYAPRKVYIRESGGYVISLLQRYFRYSIICPEGNRFFIWQHSGNSSSESQWKLCNRNKNWAYCKRNLN